jgi:hypothetical protein
MGSDRTGVGVGRLATAVGVIAVLGLICIALFALIGEPFGTLNDGCVALGGILSACLAWALYLTTRGTAPGLSLLALSSNWIGALLAVVGSGLVMFNITGWFLAGLVTTFGYALIGLWLLATNRSALRMPVIPRRLAWFGIVAGGISACGLLAAPGILARTDDMGAAPWFVTWSLYVGGLGWNILYTIWCLWLGRRPAIATAA